SRFTLGWLRLYEGAGALPGGASIARAEVRFPPLAKKKKCQRGKWGDRPKRLEPRRVKQAPVFPPLSLIALSSSALNTHKWRLLAHGCHEIRLILNRLPCAVHEGGSIRPTRGET